MENNTNEKKHLQMKLDTENLAMPEIHVNQKESPVDIRNQIDEECDEILENEEIDFSGAMPEIHMHKKK